MAIGLGAAAFVTGAGFGIGRAISLELARKGVTVSIVDIHKDGAWETLRLIEAEHAKLPQKPSKPSAIVILCDVTNSDQLAQAFAQHERTYGKLDVCINNAGKGDRKGFIEDPAEEWRDVVNLNTVSVIDGTRHAVQLMRRTSHPGVILNIASAAGLYPNIVMPIYCATKASVVMFTRSLSGLKAEGIRANVLCPEFVDTRLSRSVDQIHVMKSGGFIDMKDLVKAGMELIEDESKAGACLWLTKHRGAEYWPSEEEKKKYKSGRSAQSLQEYRKVVVHTLNHNFRSATKIVTVPFRPPVKPGHVLVKVLYAGVNASDVNFSSGRYHGVKVAKKLLPLDAGFESVGLVAGLPGTDNYKGLTLGSPVASLAFGGYAEYVQVAQAHLIRISAAIPEMLAILSSGLTASIALEQAGRMKSGETVLVTAAAGGTGQFAVQLAKLAGNTVVATCGGEKKADMLRQLGADRVIDYSKESIQSVLQGEFPNGMDLIYESVGGETFTTCLNSLAVFGRIIIIGMISQYQGENGWQPGNYPGLGEKILAKSQTVVGFFVNNYARYWSEHVQKLTKLYEQQKLKIVVDPTPFVGVESVADAVEYLHSGTSIGKVVVRISADAPAVTKSRL